MTARYLVSRVLQVPATVAGILLLGFLLVHLAPGDPVLALAGQSGDEAYYAAMRAKFGLDRPLPEQLGVYVGNTLRGDLGTSYHQRRSALELVLERVPATLLLSGTALVLASVLGTAIGVAGALRPGGLRDLGLSSTTLAVDAVPAFWLGQLALLAFALHLGIFPVQGMRDAGADTGGLAGVLDVAHHLALPALALASHEIASIARLTRAGVLEQLSQPYARTAKAKGLSHRRVVTIHTLRQALLPVVTVIGSRVGQLVAASVVVEVVFGWPGLGRLLLTATQNRDTPVLLAIFLLIAVFVVLANLVTDLIYGWLDPRIRLR